MADKVAKGRHGYKNNLPSPPTTKLTIEQVEYIREQYAKNIKPSALADQFGVDVSTIRKIIRRTLWK
jgi:DNA invertase Pin-like site-specific DNA recombinase